MKKVLIAFVCAVFSVCSMAQNADPVVVQNDGIELTREELQYIVQGWGRDMQIAAANNAESRRELINMTLAGKKLARDSQNVTREEDPDYYWSRELQIRGALRHLFVQRYLENVQVPDMQPLARERYLADKDKYGKVPERRMTSHILFRCIPNECDSEQLYKTANEVLSKLKAGGNFEQLAAEYSEDPGSKDKGGKFDRWLAKGEPHVVAQYTNAAFDIGEVGGITGLVNSKYGLHIIRLDEIQESRYLPFEEVEASIIQQLEQEYRKLAAMDFDKRYAPVGEVIMDDALIEDIFAPYQSYDAEAEDANVAAPQNQPAQ
jgi:parvulin-like peptidyl-prolyl isomerase